METWGQIAPKSPTNENGNTKLTRMRSGGHKAKRINNIYCVQVIRIKEKWENDDILRY